VQLLPPTVLMAARGLAMLRPGAGSGAADTGPEGAPRAAARTAPGRTLTPAGRKALTLAAAAALLVPLVRFGPRYGELAEDLLLGQEHRWSDVALDRDSRAAAAEVDRRRRPGDTLFVWGYRPGIFVYTRLPVAARFWDSQPLTGVSADRHLHDTLAVLPAQMARNRTEFAASKPTFVVDSLSLSNPRLALEAYAELDGWRARYRLVARTPLSLIYELAAR